MIKTILKETIITILLCVAILLILSVMFYDYNPINKIVPNKIEAYSTDENIREEINANITELQSTNVVYKIEDSDLNVYIRSNTYVQGKANPFAASSSTATNTEGNTENPGNSTTNTNSNGTFWNSTGTK